MIFMKRLLMLVSISIILLFGAAHSISAQDSSMISSEPKNLNELNSIITKLLKEKRFEESLFYLDKILEIDPNHTSALLNKGSVLVFLDRSEEAIPFYDTLLKIEPNNIKGLTSKAAALANIGENLNADKITIFQNALELYNKALSIDNNNEKIENNIARLLSKTPTISVHGFSEEDNEKPKYDIHLRVTVRDSAGELVSVVESKSGRYLPVSFTDEVFDIFFEKEIVEINGEKSEVAKYSELYTTDNDDIGNFFYEVTMNDYQIHVFEVFPPHVSIEPNDQLYVEWTISRKL